MWVDLAVAVLSTKWNLDRSAACFCLGREKGDMRKPTPKARLEKLLESGKLSPKQSFEAIKLLHEWDEPKPVPPKPESPEEREQSRAILDKALHPEPNPDSISQTKSPHAEVTLAANESAKEDKTCLAYRDDYSEAKFKRLLSEGHRVFQYILTDGRTVDEDMHDCRTTQTDSLIPKIEVSKQPEWRMVLRISKGELRWYRKKDAPPSLHPPMHGGNPAY